MKKKSVKEIKKIVKEIYGEDYKLMGMTEKRNLDNELLWDTLRFKQSDSKAEIQISYTDFEDIGYITEEYGADGDYPECFDNWNELDKRLEVEQ